MQEVQRDQPHQAGLSADACWLMLLKHISDNGSWNEARGLTFKECLSVTTVTDMTRPLVTVRERKIGNKFRNGEAYWILSGRNDVKFISQFSERITSFSNDGKVFDGAYGPMLVDQMRYLVDTLWDDPGSRQAVATIWRRNPRPSKDVPCTLSVQMIIRDGKLHCLDTMRSSDIWLGWPYDVFNFSMLSLMVLISLKERLSEKPSDFYGDSLMHSLALGNLYLTAGSSHFYDKEEESIRQILENPTFVHYDPLDAKEFAETDDLLKYLLFMSQTKEPHPAISFQEELVRTR